MTAEPDVLVSVVLPTRDRARTLRPAIDSVLRQTYRNLELLVVDDSSHDGTAEVLRSIDDHRLSVTSLDRNVGPAQARNVAIERAKGGVIAFQDSDDVWTETHLDALLPAIHPSPSDVAVAYGLVRYASGRIVPGELDVERDGDLRAVLARYNIVGLPACAIRSDVLDAVGAFDPSLRRLEDWDLFLRISNGHRFAFVDEVVLEASDSGERVSTDVPAYYAALDRLLAKHRHLFATVPDCRVSYQMQLARFSLRRGRPGEALRRIAQALRDPAATAAWFGQRVVRRRSPVDRGVL